MDPIQFVPEYARRKKEAERSQTIEEQIVVLSAVLGCGPGSKVN